jgi:hypothetical protein
MISPPIIVVPPKNSWETPGVRKRALLMQDMESLTDARRLETHSDVFALHQEEVGHLVS